MKPYTFLAPFGFAVFTMGCQTSLKVSNKLEKHGGIPIAGPQTYVMGGTYTQSKIGKKCTDSKFTETISLPTGDVYYVNTRGGALSTSEFNMTMTPAGTLSSISLNSAPAGKDTIDSLAGVATNVVFPLFGIDSQEKEEASQEPAAASNGTEAQNILGNSTQAQNKDSKPLPLCDTGATKPYIMTLDDFMAITEANRPITQ